MQLDLQQIVNGLRKRWWLALLAMVSAAAVAYLYTNAQPRIYQAQVTLQAQPNLPDNALAEAIKKEIEPSSRILTSKDFLRDVIDGNNGAGEPIQDVDLNALPGRIKVQPRPEERTILMTVDDRSGEMAALLADRIADTYVEYKAAQSQQNQTPGGLRVDWLKLQTPDVPGRPYQPRPLLYSAAAALFGLILGLLLAIGLELLDTTLKSPDDVNQYVGLSTLGIIPRGKG